MRPLLDNTALSVPKMPRLPIQAGRPRLPLPDSVKSRIEKLYTQDRLSQAKIAELVGVSIPRVQRHLIAAGLYTPRPPIRTPERAAQLDEAVSAYIEGDKVVDICQGYEVNPAELYRELRARNVPFRSRREESDG